MTIENWIKGQLVTFAAREGLRYGGVDTALAVAQVIANRVAAGWEGGDWLRCIEKAPAFQGTIHPVEHLAVRDSQFRLLLSRIEDVYHGVAADLTHGALYYAQLDQIDRPWFRENILDAPTQHPRLANFGLVYFFQ